MLSTSEAWQSIVAHSQSLEPIQLPLAEALGRTLRLEARADADSPPFDASAMDGYAIARLDGPASLRIIGEAQAGRPFAGRIGAGECVRIFTGAPVPDGTERVIKQEDVTREGDQVLVTPRDGPAYIRRRGENRRAGAPLIPAGALLGPAELAGLAAAGITAPTVTRAPWVVHLVTGNELVPPDQTPAIAQIRDSNSTLVAALLGRTGAVLAGHAHARDDLAAAKEVAATLPAHDLLLISGGASVGDHDFARPLLEALGFTLHFHILNLRPGKPLVFASRGAQLAFALPGNPVSHWVVYHLFVGPLLQRLQSGATAGPTRLVGRLARQSWLPSADARQTFWPSRVSVVNGAYEIAPMPLASSGDSAGLVGANALLVMPSTPGLDTEKNVEFILCP